MTHTDDKQKKKNKTKQTQIHTRNRAKGGGRAAHSLVGDELHLVLPLETGVSAPPNLEHPGPLVLHRGPHQRHGRKGRHVGEGHQDVQFAHLSIVS